MFTSAPEVFEVGDAMVIPFPGREILGIVPCVRRGIGTLFCIQSKLANHELQLGASSTNNPSLFELVLRKSPINTRRWDEMSCLPSLMPFCSVASHPDQAVSLEPSYIPSTAG